jgi:hypothetical protein
MIKQTDPDDEQLGWYVRNCAMSPVRECIHSFREAREQAYCIDRGAASPQLEATSATTGS